MVYFLVQFGPPYYRKWKVKGMLSESANRLFNKRQLIVRGDAQDLVEKVKKETLAAIIRIGVKDPSIKVGVQAAPSHVTVTADYTVRIEHPLVNKVTTLRFRPTNTVGGGASSN